MTIDLVRVTWLNNDRTMRVAYAFFPDIDIAQEAISAARDCLLADEAAFAELGLIPGAIAEPGSSKDCFVAARVSVAKDSLIAQGITREFGGLFVMNPAIDSQAPASPESWMEAHSLPTGKKMEVGYLPIDLEMLTMPEPPPRNDVADPAPQQRRCGLLSHSLH